MLWVLFRCTLESQITRIGEPFAIFAVLSESDHSNKHLILHKESIISLFESDEEFERTKLSAPGMATLGAKEIEAARLGSLEDEEPLPIPIVLVFLYEKVCKRFFTGPLNRNPFELRLLVHGTGVASSHIAHWDLAIHVVLYLLDRCISVIYRFLLFACHLKPVCDFEDVALFQILVVAVTLVIVDIY